MAGTKDEIGYFPTMGRTDEQTRIYKRMSMAERVATGCALHDFAFQRLVAVLRRENPKKSERALKRLATKRMLGESARDL